MPLFLEGPVGWNSGPICFFSFLWDWVSPFWTFPSETLIHRRGKVFDRHLFPRHSTSHPGGFGAPVTRCGLERVVVYGEPHRYRFILSICPFLYARHPGGQSLRPPSSLNSCKSIKKLVVIEKKPYNGCIGGRDAENRKMDFDGFLLLLAPGIHADQNDLYKFLWLDADKKVYVLQNKVYEKRRTAYFNLGYIADISSNYESLSGFQGALGYFFAETGVWSCSITHIRENPVPTLKI